MNEWLLSGGMSSAIKPCDNHLYEKWMAEEVKEEDLRYDFCYERHNQLIVPDVLGKG